LESRGFLLSGDDDPAEDKKIEPAVPDEREEDVQNDKQKNKDEQVLRKVHPGL